MYRVRRAVFGTRWDTFGTRSGQGFWDTLGHVLEGLGHVGTRFGRFGTRWDTLGPLTQPNLGHGWDTVGVCDQFRTYHFPFKLYDCILASLIQL